MLPFSGYAFNKSHTAGYGLVSYWTAYLKANYPAEYMAALLTSVGDDKDKAGVYLADARKIGVKVLPPDVNESVAEFTAVGDDVRFGLRSVRNVGDNVIESIVEARKAKGKFTSFSDFLDKAELPALQQAGHRIPDQGRRVRLPRPHPQGPVRRPRGRHRRGRPGEEGRSYRAGRPVRRPGRRRQRRDPAFGLDFPIDDDEWPRKQLLATEREMLGLYVSAHPLDGAEHILAAQPRHHIAELLASGRTEGDRAARRPDHRRRSAR